MPKAPKVTRQDIERGGKRVNISLSIKEYDDLMLCAEYNNLMPGAIAASWLKMRVRDESAAIRRTKYVPIAQRGESLFETSTKKKGASKKG